MNTTAILLCAGFALAAPVPKEVSKSSNVVVVTSLGTIELELFPEKAPKTVANFLKYADDKFYDDLTFHRAIPNFMIQGGGHDKNLAEKKGRDPIVNESSNGLLNEKGTLSMARTAVSDSGTSQFFINLKDNAFLDFTDARPGYCVFGKVTKGMDIVEKIAGVETGNAGGLANVPKEPVVIKSIRRK